MVKRILEEDQRSVRKYAWTSPEGYQIVFRSLPLHKWIKISAMISSGRARLFDVAEDIFRHCCEQHQVMSLIGSEHLLAGLVPTVVKMILELSGPSLDCEDSDDLTKHMERAYSLVKQRIDVFSQMAALVVKAFPAYTIEDLYDLDWVTFLERVAQAEIALNNDIKEIKFNTGKKNKMDFQKENAEIMKAYRGDGDKFVPQRRSNWEQVDKDEAQAYRIAQEIAKREALKKANEKK